MPTIISWWRIDVRRRAPLRMTELEELLKNPELTSLLTVKQRVETPFNVAQLWLSLGEYEKSLQKYEELAKKWGNSPEGLSGAGRYGAAMLRQHGKLPSRYASRLSGFAPCWPRPRD